MRILLAACLVAAATPVEAQSAWTWRARTVVETTATELRRTGAVPEAPGPRRRHDQRLVATADAAWSPGERLRAAAAVAGSVTNETTRLRARELYVRASAASWLDLEAGRRILRWGVGYGFSPAGVLDPPRQATDPTDRLQVNEGRLLARADLYRGDTALSVVGADGGVAARLSTVFRGLELAAIATAGPGKAPRQAATVTHVIGQQLEWHGEVLIEEHEGAPRVSAAAGIQYTFAAGLNVVVEYHHHGRGLDAAAWNDVLAGRRPAGPRPSRRNAVFVRLAHAATDSRIVPEMIVIAGADDRSWTLVPSVTWTPHRRVQAHVRATRLTGPPRSIAAMAPFSTTLTAGAAVRF
ncbi:MAG TPA: hypothetical protein VM364_13895 [Vicinamibacterales bacterium]|nr:hypothetical protein [Vicinamibacterales bacterium]